MSPIDRVSSARRMLMKSMLALLPPAHFGYLATGVDDDRTAAWNHEAFSLLEIRSNRFVDVSRLDTSIQLLGTAITRDHVIARESAARFSTR